MNADDFGLTRGVNRAIAELHRAGAISSATLMAGGDAFEDAVAVAHAQPSLGVGCHVVLVDGTPLSPPESIPSLLGAPGTDGAPRLRPSLAAFARAALLGQLREEEIERETETQILRLLEAGIRPTHLDTHKHTHLFPAVLRAVLRATERLGVPAVRNPFEPAWAMRLGHGGFVRRLQMHVLHGFAPGFEAAAPLREGFVRSTDGAIGISTTGSLGLPELTALLDALPAGTWELVCHPGYADDELDRLPTRLRAQREIERETLLAAMPSAAAKDGFELTSFQALASEPALAAGAV